MQYHSLLQKMADHTISETEKEELYAWLQELSEEEYIHVFDDYQQLITMDVLPSFQPEWLDRLQLRIYREEREMQLLRRKARIRSLVVRLSAAALLVLVATCWWFYNTRLQSGGELSSTELILPGGNGAVLTLSDGRRIVLDSLGNGHIAAERGAQIILENNMLQYKGDANAAGTAAFNTVSTPNGRQFQLMLSDGTRVWLNAASTIRYPTTFDGTERRIQISGEAYLEVAQLKNKPFFVESDNRAEIAVLGTSFNIQAYTGDNAFAVTLLDGKVALRGKPPYADKKVLLQPGQKAMLVQGKLMVKPADTEQAVAWKNGLFNFENADVKEAMMQLARWYNVEVEYPKGIPDVHFMGYMRKDLPLQEVLKGLQDADLHVTIENGRRLVVLPR
ncbi:FecR family protein [Filimonas effusa]|uniref:FecR family protein n=1 Tax=Filimonas effusa TaxID=2508721 RepID=A0A4Q1D5M1_9BACT|nr:FecR family protein [Filimonas effusa]RXK82917.1 FecR family protein [Filimonas effusa]